MYTPPSVTSATRETERIQKENMRDHSLVVQQVIQGLADNDLRGGELPSGGSARRPRWGACARSTWSRLTAQHAPTGHVMT
jgi:hypothetical protein